MFTYAVILFAYYFCVVKLQSTSVCPSTDDAVLTNWRIKYTPHVILCHNT